MIFTGYVQGGSQNADLVVDAACAVEAAWVERILRLEIVEIHDEASGTQVELRVRIVQGEGAVEDCDRPILAVTTSTVAGALVGIDRLDSDIRFDHFLFAGDLKADCFHVSIAYAFAVLLVCHLRLVLDLALHVAFLGRRLVTAVGPEPTVVVSVKAIATFPSIDDRSEGVADHEAAACSLAAERVV
jgi:hypothetical protein